MKEYEAMPEKGDPTDLPEVCRADLLSMQHTEFVGCIVIFRMLLCCVVVHILMCTVLMIRHLGGSLV